MQRGWILSEGTRVASAVTMERFGTGVVVESRQTRPGRAPAPAAPSGALAADAIAAGAVVELRAAP